MPDWIGKTIGKVQIEKPIAHGGMAEVYLGTHLTLERQVVIKLLHSYIEEKPAMLDQFHREARVVAGLRHPNIVRVFDFDAADGHPYIVMEYLGGPTLATYLKRQHQRKKHMPPNQIAHLLKDLAGALDYAHEQGVIHRDVKPGNIMLRNNADNIPLDEPLAEDVEPIVTDFGLVRVMNAASLTASGFISGTPAYMSPEQGRGDPVDHRTDIYSLGAVLYEMLAGHVPFEADNAVTVLHMHIHTPPPPISGISPALQAVVDRALAKNMQDRYQTCQELARDFYRAVGLNTPVNITRKPYPGSIPSAKNEILANEVALAELDALDEAPTIAPPKTLPKELLPLVPKPQAKATRRLWWIGGGFVSLFFLVLLAVGALLFSRLQQPTAPVGPPSVTIPNTGTSQGLTAMPELPSAKGMVQIPAGTYEVGTTQFTDEYHLPPKKVTLNAFWIDQYQVTNAEYQEFMGQTHTPAPEVWPGDADHPVRGVTWSQAFVYCTWVNKHLPLEVEWEAAGRGSSSTPQLYPWGDDASAGGQTLILPDQDTYPVGTIPFNKSQFGVFDMVGNVWEWVGEPYGNTQAGYNIVRGGRFGLPILDLSYRLSVATDDDRYVKYTGFRCAASQVR